MRTLLFLAGVLVLAAMAVLQFNDPDPLVWVTTYSLCAATLASSLAKRPLPQLAWLAFGMTLFGMLQAAPGLWDYLKANDYGALLGAMSESKPYVEPAREFLGLGIALLIVWCGRSR